MSGQQQDQAQEQAAFEQALAGVSGQQQTAAPAAAPVAAAEVAQTPATTQEAAAPAEAAAGAANGAPEESEAKQAEGGDQPASTPAAAEDDPEVFEGFKRSELRRLLGNAAEVENVKRQLDKANGKIGELNRKLQQAPAPAPAAAPVPTTAPELPPELKQFEEDYPEVAAYVKALGITPQQPRREAPPAEPQQPAAAGVEVAAQAGPDPMAIELAVMDRMHKGWREKLASQDFNLWLASQQADTQQAFHAAATADSLADVIGKYDQWSAARVAAANKVAKGQQRLQAAVTPSGNASRPQAALTEQEAFEAALKS